MLLNVRELRVNSDVLNVSRQHCVSSVCLMMRDNSEAENCQDKNSKI